MEFGPAQKAVLNLLPSPACRDRSDFVSWRSPAANAKEYELADRAIWKDVTFRICPIDKAEAMEMIQEIEGFGILNGVRGKTALDICGLAELIAKVSRLMTDNPTITEIDLNPVRVYTDRLMVLDARIFA